MLYFCGAPARASSSRVKLRLHDDTTQHTLLRDKTQHMKTGTSLRALGKSFGKSRCCLVFIGNLQFKLSIVLLLPSDYDLKNWFCLVVKLCLASFEVVDFSQIGVS
ncbi:hypothetical protein VNO77_16142 [Canavalia gladiata]|uniref:Uncharacterized protein n=1 Tax=Canavalia gladiata TaxID=3824 RepID=A0AAN9M0I3_CANGL